jgi:pSer/pThr/pTyr-binding forkhead associated (FHA) protein
LAQHPFERHTSTPEELHDRLAAERRGTPYLVYRDGDGRQVLVELPEGRGRLTIGRYERNDITLAWDGEVSRLHAVLELVGVDWVLTDDRMSRNGSYVNGDRVSSHVLRSGDLIAIGETLIAFSAPGRSSGSETVTAGALRRVIDVTPAQRRVLVALCRPVLDHRPPATNREIATELTVAIDTVKGALSRLFELFEIGPDVPQNQKRALLAQRALQAGVVRDEDLFSSRSG